MFGNFARSVDMQMMFEAHKSLHDCVVAHRRAVGGARVTPNIYELVSNCHQNTNTTDLLP